MAIPPPKESEVKEPDKIVFVDFFSLTFGVQVTPTIMAD